MTRIHISCGALLLIALSAGSVRGQAPLFAPSNELRFERLYDVPYDDGFIDADGYHHDYRHGAGELRRLPHLGEDLGAALNTVRHVPAGAGTYFFQREPDGATVRALVVFDTPWPSGEVGVTYRFRASEFVAEVRGSGDHPLEVLPPTYLFDEELGDLTGCGFQFAATRPDGAVCGDCGDELVCISVDDGDPEAATVAIEVLYDDGDRVLGDAAEAFAGRPLWTAGVDPAWDLVHYFTPDGDLFLYAEATPWIAVFQRRPDGELVVRALAPDRQGSPLLPARGTWDDLNRWAYDPDRDLMALFVDESDWIGWHWQNHCSGDVDPRPFRWGGYGLRVFPVDSRETGYVSLTEPGLRLVRCGDRNGLLEGCRNARGNTELVDLPGGGIGIHVWNTNRDDDDFEEAPLYRLDLDPTGTDFDGDGIRTAEEDELGTSDFDRDSDGDGATDHFELAAGLDPTDPADADVRPRPSLVFDQVTYVRSQLLRLFHPELPVPEDVVRRLEITQGPYCQGGTCYGPDGSAIATGVRDPFWIAFDGTYVLYEGQGDTWVREFFSDGRQDTFALATDFFDDHVGGTLVPVTATLAYWVSPDLTEPVAYILREGQEPLLIDFPSFFCDLGLGPCETFEPAGHTYGYLRCGENGVANPEGHGDLPLHDLRQTETADYYRAPIDTLGVDPVSNELLLRIPGNYDQWVVGVSPDGDVTLRFEQDDLLMMDPTRANWAGFFPEDDAEAVPEPLGVTHIMDTGHGDAHVMERVVIPGAFYEDATIVVRDTIADWQTVLGHGRTAPASRDTVRVWDDTFLADEYENVRYEYGFDPGDVVIVDVGATATGFRSGPRGGLGYLWRGELALGTVTGIDISAEGRMCMTGTSDLLDPDIPESSHWLLAFDPAADELWDPDSFDVVVWADGDMLDCAYDGETVWFLERDDSEVVLGYYDADAEELVSEETWPAATGPNAFAFVPPEIGRIEPFRRQEDNVGALAYDNDDNPLILRHLVEDVDGVVGAVLERDGTVLAVLPVTHEPNVAAGEAIPTPDLVVRADGLIVAAVTNEIWAVRPDTGAYVPLTFPEGDFTWSRGPRLAVRPGGDGAYPWTMTAPGTSPDAPDIEVPEGTGGGSTPDADPSATAGDDGCGCRATGSAPPSLWLLGVALLIARARRKRAYATLIALVVALPLTAHTTDLPLDTIVLEGASEGSDTMVVYSARPAADGFAEPVVVIHGGPGLSHEYARPLAEPITAAGHRALFYDPPGMTPDGAAASTQAISRWVDDLERLRGAIGAEQLHLVAHSWGGVVAGAYLDRHPGRVASLALLDTMVPSFDGFVASSRAISARIGALGLEEGPPPATCAEGMLRVLPAYFHDPEHPFTRHMSGSRCSDPVLQAAAMSLAGEDFSAAARAYAGPVTIIQGESDPIGRPIFDAVSALYASATAHLLPACGHIPWEECPDAFTPLFATHLSALPSTEGVVVEPVVPSACPCPEGFACICDHRGAAIAGETRIDRDGDGTMDATRTLEFDEGVAFRYEDVADGEQAPVANARCATRSGALQCQYYAADESGELRMSEFRSYGVGDGGSLTLTRQYLTGDQAPTGDNPPAVQCPLATNDCHPLFCPVVCP